MKYKSNRPTRKQVGQAIAMQVPPVSINFLSLQPMMERPIDEQTELYLFLACLYGECRGEEPRGIAAVGQVIMNRWMRRELYWGFSVRDIILDCNQGKFYEFACMEPGELEIPALQPKDTLGWAKVFTHGLPVYLEPEPLHRDSAFFYCTQAAAEMPFFSKMRRIETIGSHVFFTDEI